MQGRAQEALTLLTAAIVASPTYAEAHNNLGVLQRDVGAIPEVGAMPSQRDLALVDTRFRGVVSHVWPFSFSPPVLLFTNVLIFRQLPSPSDRFS